MLGDTGPSPSRSIKITFQQKVVLDIALEDLVDALADRGYESDGSLDSKAGRELDEDEDVNPILGDFECDPNLNFAMHETLPDLSDLTESEPENGLISHKRTVDMAALDKTAKKKLKKQNYNKRRRKEKRIETSGDEPYSKLVGDRRCNEADIITLDCDAAKLPVSSTGWQGVRKTGFEEYTGLSREETIALPWMRYLDWDGSHNVVICDRAHRGMVHLIGAPRDPNWPKVLQEAARVIEKGRVACKFSNEQLHHKRGHFAAEAVGYSHGGGQIEPSNTQHSVRNLRVLDAILANPAVQRISGVANAAYKRYCPDMYEQFKENDRILRAWKPSLRQNFPKTVFAATTINFGPQSITDIHIDSRNRAPASCSVSTLGPFNSTSGGELVLWNLGLIIRFPSGCTILLPSALITHSNLAIQPGERRYSVTQYSAAALSRFVENGFRNDVDILNGKDQKDPQAKAALLAARKLRWKEALKKYRVW